MKEMNQIENVLIKNRKKIPSHLLRERIMSALSTDFKTTNAIRRDAHVGYTRLELMLEEFHRNGEIDMLYPGGVDRFWRLKTK